MVWETCGIFCCPIRFYYNCISHGCATGFLSQKYPFFHKKTANPFLQVNCFFSAYAFDAISPTTPITRSTGNAMEISPPATITSRINGRNTIVSTNFEIPQAAFNPKKNNFPKTPNRHMINNNVNIFSPFLQFCSLV